MTRVSHALDRIDATFDDLNLVATLSATTPLLATRADTGEVLHARMRKGSANTQRGVRRFLDELIARVRRAGATGSLTGRFDSGFWSNDTIVALNRLDVRYTMAVRCGTKGIADAIAAIPEGAWQEIEYTVAGQAQVADCAYTTGKSKQAVTRRLVVRRTRLTGVAQQRLWPDWRHHAFLTDLKEGAGLEHVPSGNFHANSAWLQCAVLAHNLIRWTTILGGTPRRRATDRCPHDPHPTPRTAQPGRQPRRTTHTAAPDRLAVGDDVHHRARHAAHPATADRLTPSTAVRRAAHQPALTTPHARHLFHHAPSPVIGGLGYADPTTLTTALSPKARSVDRGLGDRKRSEPLWFGPFWFFGSVGA